MTGWAGVTTLGLALPAAAVLGVLAIVLVLAMAEQAVVRPLWQGHMLAVGGLVLAAVLAMASA